MSIKKPNKQKTVEINAELLSKCTMYGPVYSTHFKFITKTAIFNPESNSV